MAAFPSTPILDTGAGAAENPLNEGRPWLSGIDPSFFGFGFARNGTGGIYAPTDDVQSRWPTVFSQAQEVYAQLTTVPLNLEQIWLGLRASYSPTRHYKLYYIPGGGGLTYQLSNQAGTLIAFTAGVTLAAGDWYGYRAIGGTITAYAKRGTRAWTQILEVTDTSVPGASGGQIGIASVNPGHAVVFANFGGGVIQNPQDNPLIYGRGATR